MQSIYLAGGCFWCTESIFLSLKGVTKVVSGYIGGHTKNPTYSEICKGNTGYAEAIKCEYNEDIINLEKILEVFFMTHNPTQLNRQGNDIGTQYRSAIFTDNVKSKKIIKSYIEKIQNKFSSKIVTEVSHDNNFYEAEEYHQNYFEKNPYSGYCLAIVRPKMEYLRKEFSKEIKKKLVP